tara:strand:+ start:716 stop:952 length:237 start_codon:yes stop_codon:yes gene_type:complete
MKISARGLKRNLEADVRAFDCRGILKEDENGFYLDTMCPHKKNTPIKLRIKDKANINIIYFTKDNKDIKMIRSYQVQL